MAYIGNDLQVAYQSYQIIDDISGSFNGSTTSFALLVGGVAPVPFPINEQQCLISVGGVIQEPDPTGTNGFKFSGGNIVFSSAPGSGEDFFGVILAGADYVNVGVNYPSGSVSAPSITFDTDLDTGIYNPAANELGLVTNGSDAIRINSSGDVTIGSDLTVDTDTLYVDSANDRVGIGTTSPGSFYANKVVIDIGAAAQDGLTIKAGTTAQAMIAFADGTSGSDRYSGYIDYNHNTNALSFGTNGGSEQLRIDSSGRLLVGTSSSYASVSSVHIKTGGNTASTYGFYVENSTPGLMFAIEDAGRTYTGTLAESPYNNTTGSAANLFVSSGGVLFRSTSSLKYKTDIANAPWGLSEIMSLRPVTYKTKTEDDKGRQYGGLIAEEVHDAGLTDFVQYADDGTPDALAYGNMVSLCIKAIQEQQTIIAELQTKVAALEAS